MALCDNLTSKYKRADDKGGKTDERIEAKTEGQALYMKAIEENRVIFAHGPAGVGKSFIASAMAAYALKSKQVERIICVRPAVGAGDPIGFLPGSADDKLMPYLRPIMVELARFFPASEWKSYRTGEFPIIEIQPLEFMRGLTFKNSFVIADETQNASYEQVKMMITRLGKGSKMVLNGDVTQSDLPILRRGGFEHYSKILHDIPEIATIKMDRRDIVRDPLLQIVMERMDETEHLVGA